MEYKTEITGETDRIVYGKLYGREKGQENFTYLNDFAQLKEVHWCAQHPQDIMSKMGIATDRKRAEEIANLFDGDIGGFDYVAMAGSEEALKWIGGAIAAELNARGLTFDKVSKIMPADYLNVFVEYLTGGKFEKSFAKDVFADLMKAEVFEETEEGFRRRTGYEHMDRIIADPRFKAVDASEIDGIIDGVVSANPEQAEKAKVDPRVIQWFVGQVMKAAKGKAPAPVVQEKLRARFG